MWQWTRHQPATADTTLSWEIPTFTKTTTVFDATTFGRILPNIMKNPHFAKLVANINSLRLQLIADETLQEPHLHILLSLYTSKNTKRNWYNVYTPSCPHMPISFLLLTNSGIISFWWAKSSWWFSGQARLWRVTIGMEFGVPHSVVLMLFLALRSKFLCHWSNNG